MNLLCNGLLAWGVGLIRLLLFPGLRSNIVGFLNVLIAEDESSDLWLLTQAIETADLPIRLQVFRDGDEVIKYLQGNGEFNDGTQHPLPDLLILDLKMPRMNGLEVVRWVRRSTEYCYVPIVMLSGSVVHEDIDQAYGEGANAFFTKPNGFEELREMIKYIAGFWLRAQRSRGGFRVCSPQTNTGPD